MKKNLPLHWLILIGMALGILFGIVAVHFGWHQFTTDWIKPWGTIFINLLKLIAVPLIIVSLISGISGLNDVSRLSRIGFKTIGLYLLTTVIAVSVGLLVVNVIKPGNFLSAEKSAEFQAKYAANVTPAATNDEGPLQFIVNLVPDNIFAALTDNTRMLQIIFFSLLFGISIVLTNRDKTQQIRSFF